MPIEAVLAARWAQSQEDGSQSAATQGAEVEEGELPLIPLPWEVFAEERAKAEQAQKCKKISFC